MLHQLIEYTTQFFKSVFVHILLPRCANKSKYTRALLELFLHDD
ncbi:hypothetical protein [Candidatus Symbiopectobacterium sp.]|nr:hypothetical protein [Candidatus Symbiopectobacterium sp.]